MAISYPSVFAHLGALVGRGNNLKAIGTTTLPADLSTILAAFGTANTGTSNAQLAVSGLAPDYAGLMNAVTSLRQTIYGYADNVLTDFDTVVSQLAGASTQDVYTILGLLHQDMLDNSQTVQQSVVSIGAVTASSYNVGNGVILLDGYLDGYQPGVAGGFSTIRYAGVKSELAPPSLTHAWVCTNDSYGSNSPDGAETFSWNDSLDFGPFPSFPEGAGAGPSLVGNGQNTTLSNGNFESWNANTPSSWVVAAGAANVRKDAVNFYRGAASLAVTAGNGAVTLNNATPPGTVTPLRRYCVTARLLRTGAAPAGSLTLGFTGTGYNARGGEAATVGFGQIGTTWTLLAFWVTMPAQMPADFAFQLKFQGGTPPGCQINVDDVYCTPVTYFAGINGTYCCGNIPAAVGDKYVGVVTNTEAKFQSFFRQRYRFQAPSLPAGYTTAYALLLPLTLFTATTGGPSLADSLAA